MRYSVTLSRVILVADCSARPERGSPKFTWIGSSAATERADRMVGRLKNGLLLVAFALRGRVLLVFGAGMAARSYPGGS